MQHSQNELLEKANNQIWSYRKYIETALKCKLLIGAVGGSISLHLANKISDIDFYLITENQESKDILRSIYLENDKIDFMCASIDELIKECEIYSASEHKYPTRFFRNPAEITAIMQKRDVDRPDFKREMIMRIFIADEMLEFEPRVAKMVYEHLRKGLLLIDIWDYHFNRAYGNYYECIKGQEKVLLRKYLYIISQLTIGYAILNNDKIILDYQQMLKESYAIYESPEIIEICNRLWTENKNEKLGKKDSYISAEPTLNRWIEKNLERQLQDMKEKENSMQRNTLIYDINKIIEHKKKRLWAKKCWQDHKKDIIRSTAKFCGLMVK